MASATKSTGTPKPTLLAFHGSGSNATCHTIQLVRLSNQLKAAGLDFKIESMQAPFPSPAGPGVLPFFEGMGPYFRWLPASEKTTLDSMKSGTGLSVMPPEVESLIRTTIERIRNEGGKVVGLVGFSQGTKLVAGLLRGSEIRRTLGSQEEDWLDFEFGLSICGSYPPPLTSQAAITLLDKSSLSAEEKEVLKTKKIELPTLHMQGLTDDFLWTGKLLIETSYEVGEGKSEVRETEAGHHYPQRKEDTDGIVEWVSNVWGPIKDKL